MLTESSHVRTLPASHVGFDGNPSRGRLDFTEPGGYPRRIAGSVERAIAGMDPIDQEILALRHFENWATTRWPRY